MLYEVLAGSQDPMIWNPMSEEKLRRAADYLRVDDAERVLDLGCGRGRLLCDWAERFRVQGTGVDINQDFIALARQDADARGVGGLLDFVIADLASYVPPVAQYDIVTCVGASDAMGGFFSAIVQMAKATRPHGRILVGDAYQNDQDLAKRVRAGAENGLDLIGMIHGSDDEWDAYYSAQWRAAYEWGLRYPDRPERERLLERMRQHQVRYVEQGRPRARWVTLIFARQD